MSDTGLVPWPGRAACLLGVLVDRACADGGGKQELTAVTQCAPAPLSLLPLTTQPPQRASLHARHDRSGFVSAATRHARRGGGRLVKGHQTRTQAGISTHSAVSDFPLTPYDGSLLGGHHARLCTPLAAVPRIRVGEAQCRPVCAIVARQGEWQPRRRVDRDR